MVSLIMYEIIPVIYLHYVMQCNVPTFVGNGSLCGLDTDTDGFPDVQLDCSVEQSSCEQVCPI